MTTTPKVSKDVKSIVTNGVIEDAPVKSVTYSSVIARLATQRNTDTTRAGKALRSRIRAMDQEKVAAAWPEFAASRKLLRDGNRYPFTMPATFADTLLKPRRTINDDAQAEVNVVTTHGNGD